METQPIIDPNTVSKLADFIAPLGPSESRTVSKPLRFQTISFGDTEFIQGTAILDRNVSAGQPKFSETMFGYFLREKNQIYTILDFKIDTTYFQMPSEFRVGNWVKGYDAVLYISSTGMGDCGRFVMTRAGAPSSVVPVRCGNWGC